MRQWALGVWCDEHGLKEQAKAHLTAVIRLDPSREAAWKKLGYKKHEGRWVTDAQLALEKADAEAQKRPTGSGSRSWRSTRRCSTSPRSGRRPRRRLADVTDPRAVPIDRPGVRDGRGDPAPGRAVARADRLAGGVEGAGVPGGLREVGRGPAGGDRDAPAARPARVRRPPDRPDPRADQVRGQAGGRAGLARRALRRGEEGQRPAALLPTLRPSGPGDSVGIDENGLPVIDPPGRRRRSQDPGGHPSTGCTATPAGTARQHARPNSSRIGEQSSARRRRSSRGSSPPQIGIRKAVPPALTAAHRAGRRDKHASQFGFADSRERSRHGVSASRSAR